MDLATPQLASFAKLQENGALLVDVIFEDISRQIAYWTVGWFVSGVA